MSEQEDKVLSLDEFRKRHPMPSGKLIRDPNCKSRIKQDKTATPVARADSQKIRHWKLEEALRKHGHFQGNVKKVKKIEVKENDDGL